MSQSYALRSSSSGPVFDGNTDDVLTLGSDGKASFKPNAAAGDHTVAVTSSDTTPSFLNFKLTVAQGMESSLLNPGGNEILEVGIAGNPSFLPEFNAGNKTGATSIDVGSVDGCAQKITLTGNTTLTINSKQPTRAQWYQLKVIQGAGGSHTLSIVGAQTPGGAGLTLSTTAGAVDLVNIYWDGVTLYASVAGLAFA